VEFNKEILAVFYKQNRFHNNEITKLKQTIVDHQNKLVEIGRKEQKFRKLSELAKNANENTEFNDLVDISVLYSDS